MSTTSDNDSEIVKYLNSLNTVSTYYCMWIILPTCVVGNLISLFIYSRPNLNKKTNTGFLYSWLCVLNILTVVYYSVVYRGNALFKYTLNLPCGMDDFIRRNFLNSITWMQAVICLDRFIAVVYPSRTTFMSKKIVLYGIMLVFLSLIIITNIPNLISYPVTDPITNITSCFSTNAVDTTNYLIAAFMRFYIPFALMLTLNLKVIWNLKQSKIRVGVVQTVSQPQSQSGQRQFSSKEFRFTVSTLIIDCIFLFFYLPLGVNFFIVIYNLFGTSITSDPVSNAAYNLASNSIQLLALAHTSVLFILFIVFNRNFRNEIIVLLGLNKLFSSLNNHVSNTKLSRTLKKDPSRM